MAWTGKNKRRPRALPKTGSTLIRSLFEAVDKTDMTLAEIGKRSGISMQSLVNWRSGMQPTLTNIEAVLNVVGYELAIKKRNTPDG